MLELRHRDVCPGHGAAGAPPPREGEAAGGDHETESTSDKVSECGGAGAGPRPWSGRAAGGRARPGTAALEPDCALASSPHAPGPSLRGRVEPVTAGALAAPWPPPLSPFLRGAIKLGVNLRPAPRVLACHWSLKQTRFWSYSKLRFRFSVLFSGLDGFPRVDAALRGNSVCVPHRQSSCPASGFFFFYPNRLIRDFSHPLPPVFKAD